MIRERWIIVTSINPPTQAIRELAHLTPGWTLLVVGDRKTPKNWQCEGAIYLGVEEQQASGFRLASEAPFDHYARKNLGYLYAISNGATRILETDDDNLPYEWYPGNVSATIPARYIRKSGWENVYTHFTSSRIWPRGFPLELITSSLRDKSPLDEQKLYECIIQQFLANENPDVDAVFRLTNEGEENFLGEDVVLGSGTWCPFNSQNTLWLPAAFPYLYLPFTATFRMTDIWRSFIAQKCVYDIGGNIAFRNPSMYQRRNEHSLIRDFADEVSGYLNNAAIMQMLAQLPSLGGIVEGEDLHGCYAAMVSAGYLNKQEMQLVECWLTDYRSAVALSKDAGKRALNPGARLENHERG